MSSNAQGLSLRILVIDDEPFARTVTVNQLRQLGYKHIEEASDGADAIGIMQNTQPSFDVILCDLNMPVMDGFDFIHAAQAINYKGALIVVSSEDGQLLAEAVELGITCGLKVLGALSKPLDKDALRKLLSACSSD